MSCSLRVLYGQRQLRHLVQGGGDSVQDYLVYLTTAQCRVIKALTKYAHQLRQLIDSVAGMALGQYPHINDLGTI